MPPVPLAAARAVLDARGVPGWLVGGAVRDALLGRPSNDVDITVPSGAVELGRAIARASGGAFVPLSPERGIVRVVWAGGVAGGGDGSDGEGGDDRILDLTDFVGGTLHADLAARDFTVNALAVPLEAAGGAAFAVRATSSPRTALRPEDIGLVDFVGGLADLQERRVRMTSAAAFDADPIRLLRGPRVAAELGFSLDDATAAAIADRAASLVRPARERVRDELARLLAVDAAAAWIARLESLGLLAVALPEVAACRGVGAEGSDVLDHSLAVLDLACRMTLRVMGGADRVASHGTLSVRPASDDGAKDLPPAITLLLGARQRELAAHFGARVGGRRWFVWWRLAALIHDIGKPACADWDAAAGRWRFRGHDEAGAALAADLVRGLRLGQDEARRVVAIVRHHLRPLALADAALTRRATYRFFQAAADAGVDTALHALADRAAKHEPGHADLDAVAATVATLLDAWYDAPDVSVAPPALLTGDDVMAQFGLAPGPRIGALLAGLREAQAAGEVGTVEAAQRWLEEAIVGGSE